MNSQNRMNAGAEYVLYRIWATLQDAEGIHAESLFTCLGALSGYACQVYVRQARARAGVDSRRHAFTSSIAGDGTTYLQSDAVNLPLAESPLSVWALVGRAVQKVGAPLPDIGGILAHVTQTVGTSAFGIPRVPDRHRPRYSAIVYLKQIWPQILPIARRFCRKPAQLPVLFGIAIQRGIEHTTELLSPTLSASIAMECAVAMARVALPEAPADFVQPPAIPQRVSSPKPTLSLQTGMRADAAPSRVPRSARKRRAGATNADALAAGSFAARLPAAKILATITSLAIIAIASGMWKTDRIDAPVAAPRVERKLQVHALRDNTRPTAQPIEETQAIKEARPVQREAPPAEDPDVPTTPAEQPTNEGIIVEDP